MQNSDVLKNTVFWDPDLRKFVLFCACSDYYFDPEDGGSTVIRNVGRFLPHYMNSHR
jgi:hypothetical protein